MEIRKFICIGCPLGCPLTVTVNGREISVEGNTCRRGKDYAIKEVLNPSRTVTSTVPVEGGTLARVSVKTKSDIPKGKIMDVMEEIHRARGKAPVKIGDVLIENCGGTGVSVIATRPADQAEVREGASFADFR